LSGPPVRDFLIKGLISWRFVTKTTKQYTIKSRNMKNLLLGLAIIGCTSLAQAQISMPQPSPAAKVSQTVGLTEVSVAYSRPGVKGRKIFGEVVPFGALWRTGANAATKVTFSDEVTINNVKVAKGEYSLFTTPGATEWKVVLNKNANAGTANYKAEDDVVSLMVKPQMLPMNVENFTIGFSNVTANTSAMDIMWEKTMVSFVISTDVDTKVMAQITKALDPKRDAGLFYNIATYYYDTNRNTEEAYSLITKSVDMQPQFWTVHLKAKIEARLKKFNDAIGTAQRSLDMAKTAGNMDYVRLNEQLVEACKKMK
jgi:Protein of unknown function (DUF2911)